MWRHQVLWHAVRDMFGSKRLNEMFPFDLEWHRNSSLTWEDISLRRVMITVRAASAKNGENLEVPMNDVLTGMLQGIRIKAESPRLTWHSISIDIDTQVPLPYPSYKDCARLFIQPLAR